MRWADPAAFARPLGGNIGNGNRNRNQFDDNWDGEGGGGGLEGLDLRNMNEEDRAAVMLALREFQGQRGRGQRGENNGIRQVGNLDPELPMMQLFLQTLLPWNDVRRDI